MTNKKEHPTSAKILKDIYVRTRGLGLKSINSDFMFYPTLEGGPRDAALLIRGATLPVLQECESCSVSITETLNGAGRDIVQAMKDASTFEAIAYEGYDKKYTCKRTLQCTFLSVDPVARDWENRETITTYTVRLSMVETAIEYTDVKELARVGDA